MSFTEPFNELVKAIQKKDLEWKQWIDKATDLQLQHIFSFIRNKEEYKIAVNNMLHHIFNHATYHRGQLITMLRQLGADKIPGTDFSLFGWEKK